jgi:hypothetical protein
MHRIAKVHRPQFNNRARRSAGFSSTSAINSQLAHTRPITSVTFDFVACARTGGSLFRRSRQKGGIINHRQINWPAAGLLLLIVCDVGIVCLSAPLSILCLRSCLNRTVFYTRSVRSHLSWVGEHCQIKTPHYWPKKSAVVLCERESNNGMQRERKPLVFFK